MWSEVLSESAGGSGEGATAHGARPHLCTPAHVACAPLTRLLVAHCYHLHLLIGRRPISADGLFVCLVRAGNVEHEPSAFQLQGRRARERRQSELHDPAALVLTSSPALRIFRGENVRPLCGDCVETNLNENLSVSPPRLLCTNFTLIRLRSVKYQICQSL